MSHAADKKIVVESKPDQARLDALNVSKWPTWQKEVSVFPWTFPEQEIAYILAVYETASISRAAEQCFVTQPTLSMQLKKAEELLGHLIFHRDTNSMELTDFGKSLVPLLVTALTLPPVKFPNLTS